EIATQSISPGQKEMPSLGRTKEVQIPRKQPPEAIFTTTAEEADRFPFAVARIDTLQGVHVEPVIKAINKWGYQSAIIEDPDPLWRSVNEIGVAGVQVIGSEELTNQDRRIHHQKDHAGQNGNPMAAQLPPNHSPLGRHIKALLRWRHPLD